MQLEKAVDNVPSEAIVEPVDSDSGFVGTGSDFFYKKCSEAMYEQEELADYLGNSELHLVESDEGHDGFLLEQDRIGPLLLAFFSKIRTIEQQGRQQQSIETLQDQVRSLAAQVTALKARL